MPEVELPCESCATWVVVDVHRTIVHLGALMNPEADLLFQCPLCGECGTVWLEGHALVVLLLVGVRTLTLHEPEIDAVDVPPPGPRFEWDDLLKWHEELDSVTSVAPWE
jgi:hypothetical protein